MKETTDSMIQKLDTMTNGWPVLREDLKIALFERDYFRRTLEHIAKSTTLDGGLAREVLKNVE